MSYFSKLSPTAIILAITGCASLPNGPNVMVLPGTGTSFEHFRNDDTLCEQYASTQVSAGEGSDSEQELQERYDVAYVQCMYAKGQRVPISGSFSDVVPHSTAAPSAHLPPPPSGIPPPPPTN